MKANFNSVHPCTQQELDDYAETIAYSACDWPGKIRNEPVLPNGFDGYYCIDVLGKEFNWMNESFPKEQYKWFHWFESIFLVPPEMATFLKLRWHEMEF